MSKKLLSLVWLLAIGSAVLLGGLIKPQSTHFLGIAANHEQSISFSYPVEIVQTFVVEDDQVILGSQILQVRRCGLDSKKVKMKAWKQEREFTCQQTDLKVQAEFNGRVGSVNYKTGQEVQAFQPILTVHGLSAKLVKGYIHENAFNQIEVGQKVWVQSNDNSNQQPIRAIVESIGSRIVEYPVGLKYNEIVPSGGREALIHLTQHSELLVGEKVVVTLNQPPPNLNLMNNLVDFFSSAITAGFAASLGRNPDQPEGYPIRSKINNLNDHQIEASGVIQAEQCDFYFIVSDESPDDQPELLKLNNQSEIVERLPIKSDKAVDDLESISRNGESIYVLASLDRNKKKRRQLLRLQVVNNKVILTGRVNLYKLLVRLSESSADITTRLYLTKALQQKRIQIEAHGVRANDLYIGFKTPLNEQGETVFIKLNNLSRLFDDKKATPHGGIWRSISLREPETGYPTNLSDMLFYGDQLLLLGVNHSHAIPSSHLWSYKEDIASLTNLKSFNRLRAEGISATSVHNELLVVFDGDGEAVSRFLTVSINSSGH